MTDHTKVCREKRDKKIKEDDKKYKERKEAQPTYKNIYLHLMEETPKIVETITKKKILEETIKKQKQDLKQTKMVTDKNRGSIRNHRQGKKNGIRKQQKRKKTLRRHNKKERKGG